MSETPRDMRAVGLVAAVDDEGDIEKYVVFADEETAMRLRAIARRRGRELYKRLVENAEAG